MVANCRKLENSDNLLKMDLMRLTVTLINKNKRKFRNLQIFLEKSEILFNGADRNQSATKNGSIHTFKKILHV